MNGTSQVESVPPQRQVLGRFSLRTLIWLQLLLAPAFMSPIYYNIQHQHPYIGLAAWLVAPLAYVALLVGPFSQQNVSVFRRICYGAILGILYCTLAIGPLVVPFVRRAMSRGVIGLEAWVWVLAETAAVAAFVLFHYAIFGAATGGVIGLMRDLLMQPRLARTLNPEP